MNELVGLTRKAELAISRFYMGNLMSFLLRGRETAGNFAIIDASGKIGNEPPPHCHIWEDETYYVLEGEAEFFVEDQAESLIAKPGSLVFLPKDKAHAFYFRVEPFRALLMVTTTREHSVGIDEYFTAISEPAKSMELPKDAVTYVMGDPAQAAKVAARYGINFLAPDEAKERLPNYAGFGANL